VNDKAREDMESAVLRRKLKGKPDSWVDRGENTLQFYTSTSEEAKKQTAGFFTESSHIVLFDTLMLSPQDFFHVLNHEYIHMAIYKVTDCWFTSGEYDNIDRLVDWVHSESLDMGTGEWTLERAMDWLRKKMHQERLKAWDELITGKVSQ
jgi:hypothetical protein